MSLVLRAPSGDIACEGGRIAERATAGAPELKVAGPVAPGRICAHTHLYSGLAPLGMPAPEPAPENFVQILERVWWRLDRALTAETLRASARLYLAEALLAGTTTVVDHHESPCFIEGSLDVLATEAKDLGVRALLCYGATERNRGRDEAKRGLEECRRFATAGGDLVRGLVGLHASFTVSDETIREAGQLARELDTVLHVHLAEDGADVVDAKARGYAGPLERLEALEALPPGSLLAHGVHLDVAQVERAAARGCWFIQNARSNRGNKVGYPGALRATDRVALGTDGYPADMQVEVAEAATEGAAQGEPGSLAQARLDAGQRLVAERYGVSFSSLEPGAAADLVIDDPAGRHVVVDGRLVVQNGRLLTGDIDEIRTQARAAAARLWKAMGEYPQPQG